MVTLGNTEEGPDDLEPAGERHIQKDTPVISCTVLKYRSSIKNYLSGLRPV